MKFTTNNFNFAANKSANNIMKIINNCDGFNEFQQSPKYFAPILSLSNRFMKDSWLSKSLILALLGLTLTACGGGGGGGGGNPGGGNPGGGNPGGGNPGGGNPAFTLNAAANADNTTITFSWTNPANVTSIAITRTTYDNASATTPTANPGNLRIIDPLLANDRANVNLTKAGEVNYTISAINIRDIEDGQYHIFNVNITFTEPSNTAATETRIIASNQRVQLNFPKIIGIIAARITDNTSDTVILRWTNPANLASVAILIDNYGSATGDDFIIGTPALGDVPTEASFVRFVIDINDDRLLEGHYGFSLTPTFNDASNSDGSSKVGATVSYTGARILIEEEVEVIEEEGEEEQGEGGAKGPRISTDPNATIEHDIISDFPIKVTATKQDALGGAVVNVSFPITVTSATRACVATLDPAGSVGSINTTDPTTNITTDTHYIWTYTANQVNVSVEVTYSVAYPGAGTKCGVFTFSATEDGLSGFRTYSGLSFAAQEAPRVSTDLTGPIASPIANDFPIKVTATKLDDLGGAVVNVSFRKEVTSTSGSGTSECVAVLNPAGSVGSTTTHYVWTYAENRRGNNVEVTYDVTYPGAGVTCGTFAFTATEDGVPGSITYRGLSFVAQEAPTVAIDPTTPESGETIYDGADNGFSIRVTATKQDDVENADNSPVTVGFPKNITSDSITDLGTSECIAVLNPVGSVSSTDTHYFWSYDDTSSSREVTYNVNYPGLDITCGTFDFTATEDGIESDPVSYSGLVYPPDTSAIVDADGDGLIDIADFTDLNQVRNNLAGTGLSFTPGRKGNSNGCPTAGCNGYELVDDIDMNLDGRSWQPIGTSAAPFTGIFNGSDFEIIGVVINTEDELSGVGLFGATSAAAKLININIEGARINAPNSDNVGALVGDAGGATIRNSFAVVDKITAKAKVGGLVGDGSSATISVAYATAIDLTGTTNVGGLVGDATSATIDAAYAHVNRITSTSGRAGGLVGLANVNTNINVSLAVTNSISASQLGGLVGQGGNLTKIINSYWADDSGQESNSRGAFIGNISAANSVGASATTANLEATSDFTDIYANWEGASCNPTTGDYSTANIAADGFIPAWDVSHESAYPSLNCLSASPEDQRNATTALLDGVTEILFQVDFTSPAGAILNSSDILYYRFTLAQATNISLEVSEGENPNSIDTLVASGEILPLDISTININVALAASEDPLENLGSTEGGNTIGLDRELPRGTYYIRVAPSANGVTSSGITYTFPFKYNFAIARKADTN